MKHTLSIKRAWYALMITAGVLPIVIVLAVLGPRVYNAMLDDTLLHNHAINNRVVVKLGGELNRLVSVLQNKSDPIAHVLEQKTEQEFIELLLMRVLIREEFVNAIAVTRPRGKLIVYADRYNDIIEQHDEKTWSWISTQIQNDTSKGIPVPIEGSLYVGSVLRSKTGEKTFSFLIAVPVGNPDRPVAVLVAEVAAQSLLDKIGARFIRPDTHTYIVEGNGELLMVLGNKKYISGKPLKHIDIVDNLIMGSNWDDQKEYRGINGDIVFGTSGIIPLVNWNVVSEVSKSDILSPIYETIFTSLLVVLAVILLFIWYGFLIAGRMIAPIEALSGSFRRAAHQDYSPTRIDSSLEEFQELAKGFDAMVSEIRKHEQNLNESKKALEENEERFRMVTENIHEVFLIISAYWEEIIYVSPAYEIVWGFSCDSLYKEPQSWLEVIHPSDRAKVNLEISALAYELVQFPEYRIQLPNGEIKWILAKAYPVVDDKGEITRYVFIAQDVTERRQAQLEQEKLQHQLQQSQKMEAIGQLTGGIAHDFNNMLTAIIGYTSLAIERFGNKVDKKLDEYLGEIDIAGERARGLVKQLLTFSRGDVNESKPIDLTPLVKEVIRMLQSSFPANIGIWNRIEPNLPLVSMDPVRLHQLIMNLCINARDAIEGNGSITVSVSHVGQQSGQCIGCQQSFQGDFVELVIEDTGSGIDPSLADRIFDPFFTTKELGKGTGMGLSIVHGIVHDLGGHLLVETGPTGTTFRIYFPALERWVEDDVIGKEEDVPTEEGQGQHILIVDDEVAVARFEGELLKHHGYETTVMTDSEKAMAVFLDNPDKYDLVVTDQSMPRMTGTELAMVLLKARPELPIILYTGFIGDLDPDEVSEIGIRELRMKPIKSRNLIYMVHKHLAG